jgi:RNA polymerase primary sigma factor
MMEDLVAEGNLGLIRAAQEYDPSLGTRFSTYAYYWIRESIQAALANSVGTVRLPMNISRLLGRWRRTERRLRQLRGYPPTFEEVAAAMHLDRPTQRLIAQAHRVAHIQKKDTADRWDSALRTALLLDGGITAEESLTAREERELLRRRLERLDANERAILALKFGLSGEPPLGIHQIGARLGMTATAVQKAVAMAMRKMGAHPLAHLARRSETYGSRVG